MVLRKECQLQADGEFWLEDGKKEEKNSLYKLKS